MVQPPDGEFSSACPYVNYNDHRCGGRLSIARLEEAFRICFGAFRACPVYHQLQHEQSRRTATDHGDRLDVNTLAVPACTNRSDGGPNVGDPLTVHGRPLPFPAVAA
jgi:hypothetical protein